MPKIDIAKRRRIMQRSQKLGHCICDPRRPCPCDVFTGQGICPCAGERPDPIDLSAVRLTQLVHNAGCASKIAPADLDAVLSRLPAVNDSAVLSGIPAGDDAGIYQLTDEGLCLLQTVDVMTPCVDDPYLFGRICAANCLSDIYATGGIPRTALSILAFPAETMDGQIMYQMMRGAMEVLAEARCALIGGHSIKDEEIKLGFAITGTVTADRAARRDTAAVGDVLVLTKPLGVGVLSFARQIGRPVDMAAAEACMVQLNKAAAEAAGAVGVSACTDVTGFGLLGHLAGMVRTSGVTAEVCAAALPALEGALEALGEGVIPGAIERNAEYLGEDLVVRPGVDPARVNLGLDAQTSGGLLLAVPAERHAALLEQLARRGVQAWTIGRITEKSEGKIILTTTDPRSAGLETRQAMNATNEPTPSKECCPTRKTPCCPESTGASCCSPGAAGGAGASSAPECLSAFGEWMKSVGKAGVLDERTKELIEFALVLQARCGACLEVHLKKAAKLGITRQELDEAAWCAVAIGGAPVRMFYLEAMGKATTSGEGCCTH